MARALEQLKARAVNQVEIAHAFLARYHQVEVFLAGHDERRHLHALAIGFKILALRELGASAHAAGSSRRPRDPPPGSNAGRQARSWMGMQRPQLSPSAAS